MAKYIIKEGSIVQSSEKTSFEVTFIDEVNGKEPVMQPHEVESLDEAVIAHQLSLSALEFEARLPEIKVLETIVSGVEVKAEVIEPSLPIDPVI